MFKTVIILAVLFLFHPFYPLKLSLTRYENLLSRVPGVEYPFTSNLLLFYIILCLLYVILFDATAQRRLNREHRSYRR